MAEEELLTTFGVCVMIRNGIGQFILSPAYTCARCDECSGPSDLRGWTLPPLRSLGGSPTLCGSATPCMRRYRGWWCPHCPRSSR